MAGRKPSLGLAAIGAFIPRIALPSIGIPPSVPPDPPAPTAGAAPTPLAPDSVGATELNAGADEAQLCGTDSMPSEAARPTPALTAALPMPGEANMPVPEPTQPPSADPSGWN